MSRPFAVVDTETTGDVYSVIRDGKYRCPVKGCGAPFHTLAEKKAHVRTEHKPVKS